MLSNKELKKVKKGDILVVEKKDWINGNIDVFEAIVEKVNTSSLYLTIKDSQKSNPEMQYSFKSKKVEDSRFGTLHSFFYSLKQYNDHTVKKERVQEIGLEVKNLVEELIEFEDLDSLEVIIDTVKSRRRV